MSPLRLWTFILLTSFITEKVYANCNMYQYKKDLANSYEITLSNSCSTNNVVELGQLGKEKVTVELLGFRLGQIKEIASTGVLLKTYPRNLNIRNLQEVANQNAARLEANLSQLNFDDAKNITAAGANIILDNTFRSDEIVEICQKVITPATGKVNAGGFSGSSLVEISQAGCVIVAEDRNAIPFYIAEKILSAGGKMEIDSNFSGFQSRKLAAIAKERLSVDLSGFSTFDAKKIAEAGANLKLDNSFSGFEVSEICKLVKSPATAKVRKSGFSDFDLKRIAESGCKIYY